jgi:nitrate/nitrite transporter NarK
MNETQQLDDGSVGRKYGTTAIVFLSQIVFSVVLTVVAAVIIRGRSETEAANVNITAIWVLIIFVAVGALLARRFFYSWERLKNVKLLRGPDGLLQTLQTNAILLGAISEFVAILGFVITIMSGSVYDMVRAEAVALITFLINFPRKSVWSRIVESLRNT